MCVSTGGDCRLCCVTFAEIETHVNGICMVSFVSFHSCWLCDRHKTDSVKNKRPFQICTLYVHICTYVCIYVCVHMYVRTYSTYVHVYIQQALCRRVCKHTFTLQARW